MNIRGVTLKKKRAIGAGVLLAGCLYGIYLYEADPFGEMRPYIVSDSTRMMQLPENASMIPEDTRTWRVNTLERTVLVNGNPELVLEAATRGFSVWKGWRWYVYPRSRVEQVYDETLGEATRGNSVVRVTFVVQGANRSLVKITQTTKRPTLATLWARLIVPHQRNRWDEVMAREREGRPWASRPPTTRSPSALPSPASRRTQTGTPATGRAREPR